MRISKGLGRRGAVRAIVAFFALARAIAWQQDTPLPTQRLDPLISEDRFGSVAGAHRRHSEKA
jgi:hypothetical protein